MSYDYYAEAKRLATILSNERLNDWALKISIAMEEGVTATEILMMLRWTLGNFLSAGVGSKEAIGCAKQLYQKIDVALS